MAANISKAAKAELAEIYPSSRTDALAELSALMHTAGSLRIGKDKDEAFLATDNPALPRLASALALTLLLPAPTVTRGKHTEISFGGGAELLIELGILGRSGGGVASIDGILPELVRKDSAKKCYLRGAFLGGGFLSLGKNNHMEFAFTGEVLRDGVAELLAPVSGGAGRGVRGGKYTLYIKSKEKISDVLVYMGATKAALAVQEELVNSYMGKRATAAQNCDVANIDRAVEAAVRQIEDISYIDRRIGLETLGEKLATTAHLRASAPEMSMGELAEMLGVSKSCVSHRLARITETAEALRKKSGEHK